MSRLDWNKLRPMIIDRIKKQPKTYHQRDLIPVANEVLKARSVLVEGVSELLKVVPVKACRCCSEIHVGHVGHRIRSCRNHERGARRPRHKWTEGRINDILVPVESFHLHDRFQNVIEHYEMLKYDRVPAIVELCIQAGAEIPEHVPKRRGNCFSEKELRYKFSDKGCDKVIDSLVNKEHEITQPSSVMVEELRAKARTTLHAWETMRQGAQKLMLTYPVKVCQFCPEVHVGPIGHKVELCMLGKDQAFKEHKWKPANLDDLIPPQNVWHVRKQDVLPLSGKWKGYYGHAPAIVELCVQAGAGIPKKYLCMMKIYGLRRPPSDYLFCSRAFSCLLFFPHIYMIENLEMLFLFVLLLHF